MIEAPAQLRSDADSAVQEPQPPAVGDGVVSEVASKFYLPQLDGLRFLAFLAVFWSHAAPREIGPWTKALGVPGAKWTVASVIAGGWGVDLFFVLSSYLITILLLQEKRRSGSLDLKAFWIRRALRIWPLYYAFFFASLWLIPLVIEDHLHGRYAIAFATFAANWALAWWGMVPSVIAPMWSVSIEEQFYLLWPLAARALSPARLAKLCSFLIVVSIAVRIVLVHKGADAFSLDVWCNTLARLDPIALGALWALAEEGGYRPRFSRSVAWSMILGAPVLLLLITRCEPFIRQVPVLGSLAYTLAACACGLCLVGTIRLGRAAPFAHPALVYLGRISYGLYVFHELAIRGVAALRGGPASLAVHALMPVAAFAATLALAAVSYKYLELPFLRLKERFTVIHSVPVGD